MVNISRKEISEDLSLSLRSLQLILSLSMKSIRTNNVIFTNQRIICLSSKTSLKLQIYVLTSVRLSVGFKMINIRYTFLVKILQTFENLLYNVSYLLSTCLNVNITLGENCLNYLKEASQWFWLDFKKDYAMYQKILF